MREDKPGEYETWINRFGGYAKDMTIRDYFAAAALQGLCAHGGINPKQMAQAAYIVADEMLERRK